MNTEASSQNTGVIMSEVKHILTFTLRNELFAVDAMVVKEIVWLPELTSVEEVPEYIAGVFNLRGHIVPVMDLNIRFGHKPERHQVTDRVIILEFAELPNPPQSPFSKGGGNIYPTLLKGGEGGFRNFGIIVSDVHDVVAVPESDIESTLTLRPLPEGEGTTHLIAGEVKVGEEIIMLLDHNNLFGRWELSPLHQGEAGTPEELSVFHERAKALMQPPEYAVSEMLPFAVVSLSGEYFGVDLEVVKEFADVRGITPVPCTPPHIIGDMNLRGDIMTLVDICGMLNITAKAKGAKAVIAQVNGLLAGITVDEVIEVINISPSDVRPVPASAKAIGNDYIKGEFPYQGKMLSILDMKRVLTSREMVVEE